MSFEQKRNAERLPLDAPIDATAGGVPVQVVELSAIGCRIVHREKLSLNSTTRLRFRWRSQPVEVRGRVARQQLRPGMIYESGLQFAASLDDAPDEMRNIVRSLASEDLPADLADAAPQPPPEPAAASGSRFVECSLVDGGWHRRPLSTAIQPEEGFITIPADDAELDELCKTYEYADPDTRRLIRITLELTATHKTD